MREIAVPVELQRRLVERGVFFERTYNIVSPPHGELTMAQLAARIREVGPASTIMATDFGQVDPAAEGLELYARGLLDMASGLTRFARCSATTPASCWASRTGSRG